MGKIFFKKNKGFTVIEMLISSGIVVFLTAIFLVNYHSVSFRTELNVEAQKMVGNINLARSFSLSSKKYNNALPAGGWGIYFSEEDPFNYLIFADVDNNYVYKDGEAIVKQGGRIISLSNKVFINSSSVCKNSSCIKKATNIVFIAPEPTVYIDKTISASQYIKIELKERGIPTIKTITINSLGLAEIID